MNRLMKSICLVCLVAVYAAQSQEGFISVDGPDLKARLASAVKMGTAQREQFWVTYTFPVRPGIAFDTMLLGPGGSTISMDSRTAGPLAETRNLGVFLLYQNERSIARVEVYNLDRNRSYGPTRVYSLGPVPAAESLPFLRSLIDAIPAYDSAAHLVDAIAAHDDAQVTATLRDVVRNVKNERARTTAVSWLGHFPQQTDFLAGIVRDEKELSPLRREAAEALGDSPDPNALQVLQDLYRSVSNREVKSELLDSIGDDRFQTDSLAFLVETAQRESDRGLQQDAVEAIADLDSAESFDALKQLFSKSTDSNLKGEILEALADSSDRQAAIRFLADIARSESNRKIQESAVEALADMEDDRALAALAQSYDEARDEASKETILEAIGEVETTQALQKLMAVAQRDPSYRLRKQAVVLLGESDDPAALMFLETLLRELDR